MADKLMDSVYR